MDYTPIHELIKAVSESPLTTFEMEQDGLKLVMKKENTPVQTAVVPQQVQVQPQVQPAVQIAAASEAQPANEVKAPEKEITGKCITSPMVGTFYAASSPDKPPFVKIGDKVKKGQVVCIVEAMKLMNEIESTVDGEIVEILVENEDMVEYGQNLFVVK